MCTVILKVSDYLCLRLVLFGLANREGSSCSFVLPFVEKSRVALSIGVPPHLRPRANRAIFNLSPPTLTNTSGESYSERSIGWRQETLLLGTNRDKRSRDVFQASPYLIVLIRLVILIMRGKFLVISTNYRIHLGTTASRSRFCIS